MQYFCGLCIILLQCNPIILIKNNDFMNRNVLYFNILVLTFLFAFSSCSDWLDDDDNKYDYSSIGTIAENAKDPKSFVVITDDSLALVPVNIDGLSSYKANKGQRVAVYYTLSETKSSRSDFSPKEYSVRIIQIRNILTKDLLLTNQIDTVKKDGADIISAWISNDCSTGNYYLNIKFNTLGSTMGKSPTHYVYLAKDAQKEAVDADGLYSVEFRHNANNDSADAILSGSVSFRLNDASRGDGVNGLKIKVYPMRNEANPVEYTLKYKK